jgi:hypothetical protein
VHVLVEHQTKPKSAQFNVRKLFIVEHFQRWSTVDRHTLWPVYSSFCAVFHAMARQQSVKSIPQIFQTSQSGGDEFKSSYSHPLIFH